MCIRGLHLRRTENLEVSPILVSILNSCFLPSFENHRRVFENASMQHLKVLNYGSINTVTLVMYSRVLKLDAFGLTADSTWW